MSRRQAAERVPPSRVVAAQVVGVTPAPSAIEVLVSGACEAVHDVEGFGPRRSRRRPLSCCAMGGCGEEQDAERLPESRNADSFHTQTRADDRVIEEFPCEDRHLVSLAGEFMSHLPGDILDAPGAGNEFFDHESNAQGGLPWAEPARVSTIAAGCEPWAWRSV